jgi:hypothetical protein
MPSVVDGESYLDSDEKKELCFPVLIFLSWRKSVSMIATDWKWRRDRRKE